MSLTNLINNPIGNVFRRAYIKRRLISDGKYETDWQDITEYIKSWGKIQTSVDEIKINTFKQSGISIKAVNNQGKFNMETNEASLWFGYMTRFRTLLKIEAGYTDSDGTEYPTNPSQGIFILTNDVRISGKKNEALLNFKSLTSVFDEVQSTDIPGLNAIQTAYDIVVKIRDHTDGAGEYVFRQFITSTSWTIQTTTNNFLLDTATNIDGLSCWELMNKLAEAEGYILLINRLGGIEFRDRDQRTTTSQFSFYGQGFKDQNIISMDEVREPITKYYNYIRLKHLEPDTSTSYVTAGVNTTVDPSSSAWKYGIRTYEFENTLISGTATAQTIASTLLALYENNINEELKLKTKFCPQLEVSDRVLLNYRSYVLQDVMLWDVDDWATDAAYLPEDSEWADEKGENFDWTDVPFKILSRETDLDKFSNSFILKRLIS